MSRQGTIGVVIETRSYCSEVCLEAQEPLAGTALRVDVWLMLEYRRAWHAKALDNNTLLDLTNDWIKSTVDSFAEQGLIARPQFIRRPQSSRRPDGSETMQLFVAQDGKLFGVALDSEQDLHRLDVVNTALPEVAGPQYFVCTNAKRDICCAKFGRPTYAALHAALPDRAWQTTHVGGHRYAPNVLALPQAALYGRVMAHDVARFLQTTERNQLAYEFLRGQTSLSKVAQAAKKVVAQHAGHATADYNSDYKLLRETDTSATFATPEGVLDVTVKPDDEALSLLPSCGKPSELVKPLVGQLTKP